MVKRKTKCRRIDLIWPIFFWKYCEKCCKDFRREWGWHTITGPYHGNKGVDRYVCFKCAPDVEVAKEILEGDNLGDPPNFNDET